MPAESRLHSADREAVSSVEPGPSVEDVVFSGSGPVELSPLLHLQPGPSVTLLAAQPAAEETHTLLLHASFCPLRRSRDILIRPGGKSGKPPHLIGSSPDLHGGMDVNMLTHLSEVIACVNLQPTWTRLRAACPLEGGQGAQTEKGRGRWSEETRRHQDTSRSEQKPQPRSQLNKWSWFYYQSLK
ncbi:unnamed protein product [Pleuronectes platessa]|uniref:Uncharacterized protein n=1 Tax=Pleuronectes platessa TaxID=8262 RepID=A0A9N7U694_PLEPL|nr:unnamed protein product [Pleuronectes platessa]